MASSTNKQLSLAAVVYVTVTVPISPLLSAKSQRQNIESWRPGETPHVGLPVTTIL